MTIYYVDRAFIRRALFNSLILDGDAETDPAGIVTASSGLTLTRDTTYKNGGTYSFKNATVVEAEGSPVYPLTNYALKVNEDDGYYQTDEVPNGVWQDQNGFFIVGWYDQGGGNFEEYRGVLLFRNVVAANAQALLAVSLKIKNYTETFNPEYDIRIRGVAADNFVMPTTPGEYEALSFTTSYEDYPLFSNPMALQVIGIKTIVEEIIARPGWVSGNDIGIAIQNAASMPSGADKAIWFGFNPTYLHASGVAPSLVLSNELLATGVIELTDEPTRITDQAFYSDWITEAASGVHPSLYCGRTSTAVYDPTISFQLFDNIPDGVTIEKAYISLKCKTGFTNTVTPISVVDGISDRWYGPSTNFDVRADVFVTDRQAEAVERTFVADTQYFGECETYAQDLSTEI